MPKSNRPIAAVVALSAGMLFAATEIASAQKAQKMTYEQAYEKCRTTDMVGTGSASGRGGLTSIFARRSVHEEVRLSAEEIEQRGPRMPADPCDATHVASRANIGDPNGL